MHCPLCSSSAVLYDGVRGEQVCTRCGFVILERQYELSPEWRRRPGEELERADISSGMDVSQHDFGLGTKFGFSGDLPPSERARLRRMQILQQRSRIMDWQDRSLREALIDLDKLCEDLSLPKGVKAEISMLYRRARAKKMTAGRSAYQVLAALTLVACRLRGIPKTDDEISKAIVVRFGPSIGNVLRGIHRFSKIFSRTLDLKLPQISADSYVDRFSPQLALSQKAVIRIHEILKFLPRSYTLSKPPLFLAAVAIYVGADLAGEKLTLKKISATLGVGSSSLSNNVTKVKKLAFKQNF